MKNTIKEALMVLNILEKEPGRNNKIKLLDKYHRNKYLIHLFRIAYDPKVTYGIIPEEDLKKYKSKKPFIKPLDALRFLCAFTTDLSLRKITGNKAIKKMEYFLSHIPTSFRIWAIRALRKNLRIGVNSATYGKYWDDLVSDFGAPEYHSITDNKTKKIEWDKITFPCHAEPKVDGFNITTVYPGKKYPISFLVNGQKEYALSRGQIHYPMLNKLYKKIKKYIGKDEFLVSEGYAKWSKKERKIYKGPWSKASSLLRTGMTDTGFNPELVTKKHRKLFDKDFQLLVFEYGSNRFYSPDYDYTDPTKRIIRRKRLVKLIKKINDPHILLMPCVTLHNKKEVLAYYKECLDKGFEGIMLKSLDAPLRNKRTDDCLKLKPEEKVDGIIIGIHRGTGKNLKWAGSLVVYLTKQKVVTKCNLRTDKDRYDFWKDRQNYIGMQAEFKKQKEPKGAEISASRFIVFNRPRHDLKKIPAPKCALLLHKFK